MRVRTAAEAIARQERKKRLAKERERLRKRNARKYGIYQEIYGDDGGDYRQLFRFVVCAAAFVILVGAKLFSGDHAAPLRAKLSEAMGRNMDVQEVFSAVGERFAGDSDAAERIYQAVFHPEEMPDEIFDGTAENADGSEDSREFLNISDSGMDIADAVIPHQWTGRLRDGMALETLRESGAGVEIPATGVVPEASEAKAGGGQNGGTDFNQNGDTPESNGNQGGAAAATDTEGGNQGGAADENSENPDDNGMMIYTGENLPERVMMEQVILNWDYISPVSGVLTSPFGYRYHPMEGGQRFHYGVDLAADEGTDIVCFADGNVTAVGESVSYGRYCIIAHDGGFVTLYAHCARVTALAGHDVSRGEKIAEVGATGAATGPHLHFELRRDDVWLNPVYYLSG